LSSFTDKSIVCRDCGQEFIWSASEQEFYQSRGFENQPVRCRDCRNRRKNDRAATGGGAASYGYSNGNDGGGSRAGGRAAREMFPAICDECGKETQVPFQPTSGKPVYCSDCFERRRSYR
jgi:CxxC-x17-CxxC domain-containing protein